MGDAAVFVPEATQEVTAWVARHVPGWAVMPSACGWGGCLRQACRRQRRVRLDMTTTPNQPGPDRTAVPSGDLGPESVPEPAPGEDPVAAPAPGFDPDATEAAPWSDGPHNLGVGLLRDASGALQSGCALALEQLVAREDIAPLGQGA